jgi:hypothetical protein
MDIEGGSGGAVCVNEAGKDHASEESDPESRITLALLRAVDDLWQYKPIGPRRALDRREQAALGLDAALGAKQIVLQPRMMPRNDMRE